MARLPWERDRQRTCQECGETWRVPYGLRRQRASRRQQRMSRMQSWAPGGPRARRAALEMALAYRSARSEDDRQLIGFIDSLARCPACGATAYTETKL